MRTAPTSLADTTRRAQQTAIPLAVCLDEFLDAFYAEDGPARRKAMLDDDPPCIGSARDDAWLGAVGEHLARVWRLRIPP